MVFHDLDRIVRGYGTDLFGLLALEPAGKAATGREVPGDWNYLDLQPRASAGFFKEYRHVCSIKSCNATAQIDSSKGFSIYM